MKVMLQTKRLQNSAEKQQTRIKISDNRILFFIGGEFNNQT